ncbi:unnamed protein product [Orchesella dallaii]|uniref:Death domain-containing protein n=1 Tax=Orchesella dallaii TaxID=48710 RepID=A0ABP1RB05_9HEXA
MASWKRPSENQDESSSGHIEHLVVGDEPCAFVQVRDVLYRCASAGELWPKLIDIAKSLQVPIDRIISLETRIPTKMTTYPGALLEILEAWRGKFSAEAKLQNLINVLERNGLADCADSLRIHFNEFDDAYVISTLKKLKSTDKSSTWKNLPEHLKLWMNSKPVKFQGNENTLQELTALIATPVDDKILDALALVTNDLALSVKRIQDTIDEDVKVVKEHELERRTTGGQNNLIVLKCHTLTTELVNKLVCLNRTCLCVCKQTHDGVEGCEIVTEAHDWVDVSSQFINKLWARVDGNLYNFTQLFATPNVLQQMWLRVKEVYNGNRDNILKLVNYKIVHEQRTYLSIELFGHFLPDKLVFVNINEQDLKTYAKYGHRIGDPSKDIQSLDYVILPESGIHLFDNICRQANSNVHLIEHDKGRFKIVRTWGSQENVAKFFQSTNCTFPFCDCPTSDELVITFRLENWKYKVIKCKLDEVLPNGRRVFAMQEQIDLFELRGLIQHLDVPKPFTSYFNHKMAILKEESEPKRYGKHIPEIICKLVEHVGNGEQHENLYQLAVNTLFRHFAKIVESTSVVVEKYTQLELLEYRKEHLVFKHEVLATYFIAEMIIDQVDSGNECFHEIFRNCFDIAHMNLISISRCDWNDSEYRTKSIRSYKFRETRLFKYLDFLATQDNNKDAIKSVLTKVVSPQSHAKCIHSIVNDNLVNLFEVFIKLGFNDLNTFESEDLVVLAVAHADVSLVEFITHQHRKHTNNQLNNIKLPLLYYYDWDHLDKYKFECFISVLDVAALKSHYSLFEYLNREINQPQKENLVYFCLANTHAYDQVDDRKRIITFLFENHPSLFQNQSNHYHYLLAPNSHVDLINEVINLGVNVNTNSCRNILHDCAEYLTPEEYHRVVNTLVERKQTELFHSRDENQNTPLHVAVIHLELLDSTIQLFSSAKVDFNAVNKYNTTVLHVAVIFERSARILDSLIKAGADEKARGQVNRTVLHLAAESGNLTALKYFILRGHDVNVTDEDGNTPLHFAVYLSEANTHELVVFLVEHGADLSAPKNFGITLLDIVNRKSKIEARTMEYLEIAKMESLLTKWESEIIQHNIDKLSAFTNFESELLQKLILNGIFTQRDVEDLESIERVSLRGNKLYAMLLVKKPDFKILLSAFSDSNNVGVVSILVKELTNYMYNALMYLEVKVVNYAMHTKGYADFLNLFVQAFQETDRQAYADKLSIVQLLCTLNPQVLPPKRSEIYTSLQIAFLSEHDKKLEFIQTIITHVNQPEILDFVYLCLADTRYKYSDVNERKLIITNILQNHPALFQNPQNCYLLLAPNIHVDLIIHLINLDVDVNVTNEKKENILHLCVNYLTAEEYHCVVNVLVEKLETELFHSRDEDQKTPLHVAVRYLELLDSTIKLFSSAKVDFNAVDKYNNTALHYAVIFKRSERTLGSLIKASADEKVRGQYNRTVLHIAASSGNLAALKHFLLRGHNVNGTDEEGFTPLHLAVKLFETNAHEVVVLLVEHGADVNAINKDGETPLDIANDSYFGVASFTKRFLRKHVAKSYESIRETLLEGAHSKWQSEVINSNPEKLTVLTKCDFACIQKLKSTGTSVNVDELIGNDSPDAKDFYSMLLAKKYDLKMILKLLHDTNNTEAVILLTKEVISTLYDALMNRKYSFVHFVMQIKGVYEDLQPLLNAMELIDRHQYTDKLYIIQLIGLLDPQFLKYRRPEILSPMQLALHSRHQKQFELIQLLISHNVDLNERDRKGFTPLNYAVQQKPVPPRVIEIVKLLIENGADPDAVDQLGYTFLHRAPRYLTPELYDELILFFDSSGRKDSLKLLTHHNHSHLHLAVYNFEALMDTLDIFKSNGVDFNGQDMDGVSVVFLGIEGGRDADFLRTLLTYGADWRIPDNSNSNALHTASFFGNVSALKLFIELGCDVNAKNIDGHTPLHNAFLGQKDGEEMTEHEIEIVKLLIENGADPDAVDQQGRTFLHNAPYFLTPELYDQLIMFLDSSGRKDSLKVRDFHNWSHLHHAVANFDPLPSTLNKFKSNGIDFNGQDNDGDSVVFDAIEGGRNAEFLRTLFKYGADWRILNKTQENALHAAALYGNVSALKLFIQLGCDVNATNIEGRTPLHNVFLGETNSADMKEHEIVVILLKERVDVTVKDTQGKTAIELAKERLVSGKVKQETVKILEKSLFWIKHLHTGKIYDRSEYI